MPPSRSERQRSVAILAAIGLIVLWAYWPALTAMAEKWSTDPQYSHGFLVPAFALFLLATLLASIAFERLIDRPAIALSRRAGVAQCLDLGVRPAAGLSPTAADNHSVPDNHRAHGRVRPGTAQPALAER